MTNTPPPSPRASRLRHFAPAGVLLALTSFLLTLVPWASMWCVQVNGGPQRCPVRDLFHVSGIWSGPSTWFFWALALSALGLLGVVALGRRSPLPWRLAGGLLCVLAALAALASLLVAAVFSIGINL